MAAKTTSGKWMDVQLVIATVAMTIALALWNLFAGPDREKARQTAAAEQAQPAPPTAMVLVPTVVIPTMPPVGYTILFGGAAPQPPVVVVRNGNGGGGGGGNGGPLTSTGSS